MLRRLFFSAAVLLPVLSLQSAQGGIVVNTASGTIGGFEMTNLGVNGLTASIEITRQPNTQSFLNNVNGATIPLDPAAVEGPVMMQVTTTGTPGVYTLSLIPPNYTEVIGANPGEEAILAFNLMTGQTPIGLPNFFNASGNITSVIANNEPSYDFHQFAPGAPGGSINFTFTATTFDGANSFANLFENPGATAIGSGSFSQAAIPEPNSGALLGAGAIVLVFLAVLRRGSGRV